MSTRIILAAAACVVFAANAWAADSVKLGFMASLSGPLGLTGGEMQRGLDIALAEFGGKLGGLPVKLTTFDDKAQPAAAVQGAAKFVDEDQVDLVTGFGASNTFLAAVKPLIDAKITMIGGLPGPSPLAGKDCNPYVFVSSFQNDQWDEGAGEYMNDKGYKRVYFMGLDYQAGYDHIAGAQRTFKGETVGKVFTPITQLDFAAELAQLRAAKPDAVFVFYVGAPAIAFVKQYAQAGLQSQIPLLATDAIADELTFPAQGDAALGITFATNWSPDFDNAANKAFVAAFSAKYGRRPTIFAALEYDAMRLMDQAIREIGGKIEDKQALHAALRKADFQSIRGPFKFNNNQFPIQNIYMEHVVKNAQGQLEVGFLAKASDMLQDPYHAECPMKW
jgi:branched-chain amino acid transport system substrate-binding protein